MNVSLKGVLFLLLLTFIITLYNYYLIITSLAVLVSTCIFAT